ncbi:hypothetical protein M5K25_011158 [Dendrobium thyrsiflorum]|uniref:Transmembrane protein n=1 Tax=Dendrobium thyrsiflorum TaxID=117978 RepID=A0ABD0V2L8_DENTH
MEVLQRRGGDIWQQGSGRATGGQRFLAGAAACCWKDSGNRNISKLRDTCLFVCAWPLGFLSDVPSVSCLVAPRELLLGAVFGADGWGFVLIFGVCFLTPRFPLVLLFPWPLWLAGLLSPTVLRSFGLLPPPLLLGKHAGFFGKACELVPPLLLLLGKLASFSSFVSTSNLLLLSMVATPLQELDFSNSLPTSNASSPAMVDPGIDHGFVYNAKGQVNILQSPFFNFTPDVDQSVEEYVDRIIFQLAATIDKQFSSVQWDTCLFMCACPLGFLSGVPSVSCLVAPRELLLGAVFGADGWGFVLIFGVCFLTPRFPIVLLFLWPLWLAGLLSPTVLRSFGLLPPPLLLGKPAGFFGKACELVPPLLLLLGKLASFSSFVSASTLLLLSMVATPLYFSSQKYNFRIN